jgi:phosphohistidine phosphatase SixA
MKILLIRHARRARTLPDEDDPLGPDGKEQALDLAKTLKKSGEVPRLYLTSKHRHARQTAQILRRHLNPKAALVPLDALTPHVRHPLADAGQYIEAVAHDLDALSTRRPAIRRGLSGTVAIVLHHPRNIQCALQLQNKDPATWRAYRGGTIPGYGTAIHLTADSWDHFLQGKGRSRRR